MNKKLYVGNLNYATTDDKLQELFSQVGTVVSATILTDRSSGQSRGFGFVEMGTEESAQAAIDRFNGFQLDQRTLTVNEAQPQRERSSGGKSGKSRSGGRSRY